MEPTLRRLLAAVGEPLVDVVCAPAGLDVRITGLAIVDPDDETDEHPDQLVLVIGARGRDAVWALRRAAAGGATAVAVKDADPLRTDAVAAGVVLLGVRSDVRWERLEYLARAVLDTGDVDDGPDDLFALAQTTALLTRGIVSIEDTGSRVLAYSRSDGDDAQVDELRRLSILGWQGPADYLRMLREWGVFDRLRESEDVVVAVDEHEELGIRRRLAIGIHAGARQLGTIWVQEGATPLSERSAEVLVGAARVAAGHLVRRRRTAPGWGRDLVAGLLDGRTGPDLVAAAFGLDEHAPAVVVAFAVGAGDGVTHELTVSELTDVVSVHAAAYRRSALTAALGGRVYAVLSGVPPERTEPALTAMCAEVVAVTLRRTGMRVRAGVGSAGPGLAGVPVSRAEADRVLDAMPAGTDVALIGDLRAEVLLGRTLALLEESPDLRDPAVVRLVEYDREHSGDLVPSVLAWLDAMGDVRAAAERLTVHPNTLRYRIRRATAVADLRLDDPHARLVHHLQLLAVTRFP
ncbi:MAG: helix-turn-helix domain-containing protein [Pseudonocardia sp.]|uniref:PucR family transcriptional regulator n=1 Tax=Pseudonocardia sp. TaxID=60912 RepID=UPI001AC7266E|nr:helix-turn-helix domain-containing protein [Pseudonocardia sp.]MBN9101378.1 helix-turn-helix domain-containing protein [Pseudonocardia sp.]